MLTFDRTKILGRETFGRVYEGVWGETKVAVKRIALENAVSSEQEINALTKCNHENIIKLFHVEEDQDFRCFALELCNASLDKLFIKGEKKYLGPMPPREEVLLQLAKGLDHIHQIGLVHRDIKPENVLIWLNPEQDKVLMKWADFGFSKQVSERGTFSMTSGIKGTHDWLAPEILKLLDDDNFTENAEIKKGTVKSDVFAEGLVFGYFLLDGRHPFGDTKRQLRNHVRRKKPINLPKTKEIRKVILKMLEKEPENRISSSDVVYEIMQIRISALFTTKNYPSEEEVIKLIQEGVDINGKDENGLTPLLHLVQNKKKTGDVQGIMRCLIQNGADVNSKDEKGRNALQILCTNPQTKFFFALTKILIEHEIDVNFKFNNGSNALHYWCRHHKKENLIDIIGILIKRGIEVNCKSYKEDNALTLLCRNYRNTNLLDIIQLLIGNGINVNYKTASGSNALTLLCRNYQEKNLIDIIRLLIKSKIDIHYKTNKGWNALTLLCRYYRNENLIDIIQILIANGIDVNHKTNGLVSGTSCKGTNGSNALHFLCRNYRRENVIHIIQILVQHGINVNCKDIDGNNALTLLCELYQSENLIDIIRLLIESGVCINYKTDRGWNALTLLCQNYQEENLIEIISLLIKDGIEINYKTNSGWNALTLLCQNYNKENLINIIQLLIKEDLELMPETFAFFKENYNKENRNEILHLLGQHLEEGQPPTKRIKI